MTWVWVAVGGALGTMARHAVNGYATQVFGRTVPYATAAVNIIGAALIGLLAGLIASGRLHMSSAVRVLVFVGILGGFTTFSSLMLDTLSLSHGGEHALAFSNLIAQTLFGVLAAWGGYQLALAIH